MNGRYASFLPSTMRHRSTCLTDDGLPILYRALSGSIVVNVIINTLPLYLP